MLTYDLKVGYSCNNRCKHCVINGHKKRLINEKASIDLSTEECISLIHEQINNGVERIVLTGGEITLRKDLHLILRECVSNHLEISIQTNGRMLSDPYIFNCINNTPNVDFAIALHGATSQVHDYITQVDGSFYETCKGIRSMVSIDKPVAIKVVISKLNKDQLADIVNLTKALGVEKISFAFPHALGSARDNFESVIPQYSCLKENLNLACKIAKNNNINIELETIPFCIVPNYIEFVGELYYLKNETVCSPVNKNSYAWNDIRRSIKKKGKRCSICYFNNICEGVWDEYYETFGGDEFIPMQYKNEYDQLIKSAIDNYNT